MQGQKRLNMMPKKLLSSSCIAVFTLIFFAPKFGLAKTFVDYEFKNKHDLYISLTESEREKAGKLTDLSIHLSHKKYSPARISAQLVHQKKIHYYFLIDTSMTMHGRAIKKSKEIVDSIIRQLPSNTVVSIYGFDNKLNKVIDASLSREISRQQLNALKANGESTELYRLIEKAQKLQKNNDKSIFVILSDGLAEDDEQSYSQTPVIEYAHKQQIILNTINVIELTRANRNKYTPGQQRLRRLADATGGTYVQVSRTGLYNKNTLKTIANIAFNYGTAYFNLEKWQGPWGQQHEVLIQYQFDNDKIQQTKLNIDFPDRTWLSIYFLGMTRLSWIVLLFSLLLIALAYVIIQRYRNRNSEQAEVTEQACPHCHKQNNIANTHCQYCKAVINRLSPLAQLLTINDEHTKSWTIEKPRTTIGRMSDNDIVLHSDAVGRWHADIQLKNGNFFIQDLGSVNGVVLNNAEVDSAQLKNGDELEIGDIKFRFEISPEFSKANYH